MSPRRRIVHRSWKEVYDEATEFFSTIREAWKHSEACRLLKTMLAAASISNDIKKTVAFLLASISTPHIHAPRVQYRSAFQHALLLTIRETLEEGKRTRGEEAICYAQEPVYTDADVSTPKHPQGYAP